MEDSITNCSCGRKSAYKKCCGKIHEHIKLALTAEDLMRSRYTAFTKANGTYLQESHHSKTRPSKKEAKEIEQWAGSVRWIKLEILHTARGTTIDTDGTVEFKAYFMENGLVEVIHENSFFEKESGLWKYKNAI